MSEIKFGDRLIFATKHLIKSVDLSRDNAVASIKSIGMLSTGNMEQWSYSRRSMKNRKNAKRIHIKIAKASMTMK